MTADANVTEVYTAADAPDEQPSAPPQQRVWSMPKNPVTRDHVDEAGRAVGKAATAVGRAVAGVARLSVRAVAQVLRALDRIPVALRLLFGFGLLTLIGVVGSIALSGLPGLVCAVVVVPVCAITVGALGHRWCTTGGDAARETGPIVREVDQSELGRSIAYVDRKLALALNTFGSERHQQAVIALFQAKTAAELALGTEQGCDDRQEGPVAVEGHRVRPRIQAGSASLAAS